MNSNPQTRPGNTKAALAAFVLVLGLPFAAIAADEEQRNVTNYDKEVARNDGSRSTIWERTSIGTSPESLSDQERERGIQDVTASNLLNSMERLQQSAEFTDLRDKVDEHEVRITDLEDRVSTLEDQPYNWEEQPPSGGAYEPVGSASYNSWEPAISNQKADFTQTRSGTQDYQRTVNVYEKNAATGEQRLVDTYTETETRPTGETRTIDVANNPNGGTDGWSSWRNTGSIYNCSGWSPSTSTVDQGKSFTQTRSCSQNQERFIYYLTSGSVIEQNRGTRTVTVTGRRSATGTRKTGVWEAIGQPTAADLRNLGRTSDPVGAPCGPVGSEIVHESDGPYTGGTIRILFRCVKP